MRYHGDIFKDILDVNKDRYRHYKDMRRYDAASADTCAQLQCMNHINKCMCIDVAVDMDKSGYGIENARRQASDFFFAGLVTETVF